VYYTGNWCKEQGSSIAWEQSLAIYKYGSRFLKKPPLSEAEKRPDFKVTS
jgi:hypothetical protein